MQKLEQLAKVIAEILLFYLLLLTPSDIRGIKTRQRRVFSETTFGNCYKFMKIQEQGKVAFPYTRGFFNLYEIWRMSPLRTLPGPISSNVGLGCCLRYWMVSTQRTGEVIC